MTGVKELISVAKMSERKRCLNIVDSEHALFDTNQLNDNPLLALHQLIDNIKERIIEGE